jgi:type I restriction enzyme S subunit
MKTYKKYKDSGINFIGNIPEHWDVKKVGHFLDFSRGLPITKSNLKDEGIPCVNYGEIHSKFGFSVNPEINSLRCVDESYLETSEQSLLKRGDFVFADTSEDLEGSGNFTCLDSDIPTFAGYHTIIIRHQNINYKFLAYYFDSLEYRNQIRSEVYGIKVFSITQAILKKSSFILPPKTEQTAIANYLDRKTTDLDHLIAEKRQLVKLYQEEKTTIINQAVTRGINPNAKLKDSGIEWLGDISEHWEVGTIKSVSSYFKGMAFKSESFKQNGIPIIKASNIKESTIKNITSFISPDNQSPNFEKVRLLTGDVIMSTVGSKPEVINSAVGQIAYISEEFSNSYLNQNTICIRANNKINNTYLNYVLHSKYIRGKIDSIALWIANQAYIEVEKVRGTYIPIPGIEEQTQIVQYIKKESARIDAKIAKAKKYVKLLTEYRTSLISEVVTGKIKVID